LRDVFVAIDVERHEHSVERIIWHLRARATQELVEEGLHPFAEFTNDHNRFPSVWARRAWKVSIDDPDDVVQAIAYVDRNPTKEGFKPQEWNVVQPLNPDGFPSKSSRKRDR